ncbi:hypothetical protein GCM10027296_32590 [Chitinimonas naiadis]
MIKIVFIVCAVLFALKIVWNIGTPFVLAWKFHSSKKYGAGRVDEAEEISMMIIIEIVLWLLMSLIALLVNGGVVPGFAFVFWGGFAGIFSSYLIAGVALTFLRKHSFKE